MAGPSIHSPQDLDPQTAGVRFTVLLGQESEGSSAWQNTARGLLAAQGVQTLVAGTGREALGLIENSAFGRGPRIHVAVLDQRMPVMGGLQILRRLQQDLVEQQRRIPEQAGGQNQEPLAPVPPAILLADTLASGTMHEALRMHVFSVLPKPIELNLLLDTLARALRRYYQNKWPEG